MSARRWGTVRELSSGRFQARYRLTPGGPQTAAPVTFGTEAEGWDWLTVRHAEILSRRTGQRRYVDPASSRPFGSYAEQWLDERDVAPKTRHGYRRLLDTRILPTFRDVPMGMIDPQMIRSWWSKVAPGKATERAHAY